MRSTAVPRCMRVAIVTIAAGTALVASCGFQHGSLSSDPLGDGRPADTLPDSGPCTAAGDTCQADGVTIASCSGEGAFPTTTTCDWGCSASGTVHCRVLVPSGGAVVPADLDGAGLASVSLGATSINSDTGAITGAFTRASGTGIKNGVDYEVRGNVAVFRFGALDVTGRVSLTGTNAIAFVSAGPITIAGTLDATAGCSGRTGGPGGFDGGNTGSDGSGAGGGNHGSDPDGGGGGGFGGNGGDGGGSNNNGVTTGTPEILVLIGGGGGGGGSDSEGLGGGGGGAVQVVTPTTLSITAGGINAGGCGGDGAKDGQSDAGGGGGGAGGAILLEAHSIDIAGSLAVNGGGGGGGRRSSGVTKAGSGSDGQLSRSQASAGTGDVTGGKGAAGATLDGSSGSSNTAGGGGGGGIGRIRLNTRTGTATVDNAKLSPSLTDTPTTCTQGVANTQ